jgi:hypothetical protein
VETPNDRELAFHKCDVCGIANPLYYVPLVDQERTWMEWAKQWKDRALVFLAEGDERMTIDSNKAQEIMTQSIFQTVTVCRVQDPRLTGLKLKDNRGDTSRPPSVD